MEALKFLSHRNFTNILLVYGSFDDIAVATWNGMERKMTVDYFKLLYHNFP
jgi:hypothetical protein